MTISNRLQKQLCCEVDFGEFYLLDVITKKHKPTIVLLVPRRPEKAHTYFGMKNGETGQWFCSLGSLLDACTNAHYIGKLRAKRLIRRYRAMRARDAV